MFGNLTKQEHLRPFSSIIFCTLGNWYWVLWFGKIDPFFMEWRHMQFVMTWNMDNIVLIIHLIKKYRHLRTKHSLVPIAMNQREQDEHLNEDSRILLEASSFHFIIYYEIPNSVSSTCPNETNQMFRHRFLLSRYHQPIDDWWFIVLWFQVVVD